MKIIGVTGGIGSGKSVVCSVFKSLGIPVYDADTEAKKLYDKFPELLEKIKKEISEYVFDKAGKVDRKKMAELVFGDRELLEKLNKLIHPLVRKDFDSWMKKMSDAPYVIKEAAILFESGSDKDCDQVIVIASPKELRIQRVRDRDRKTKQEVEQIISNQLEDEQRIRKADFVITNDEKEMIIPQVLAIHEEVMKKSMAV